MSIFSFIVWENTMENFYNQIKMFGGLDIVINTLIAISTMLGLFGIYKKIPLLVCIWFLPLINPPNITSGPHLGLWACLLPWVLGLLDHHPRRLQDCLLCLWCGLNFFGKSQHLLKNIPRLPTLWPWSPCCSAPPASTLSSPSPYLPKATLPTRPTRCWECPSNQWIRYMYVKNIDFLTTLLQSYFPMHL